MFQRKLGADYLESYGKKAVFTGIVFMHRQVNQSLPDGEPSIQYNGILGDLCGPNWKDKVVLVHNHQEETDAGIVSKTPEELLEAEGGWAKGFWELVPGVKKIQRFDFNDPRRSAWKILWSLMKGTPNNLENKLVGRAADALGIANSLHVLGYNDTQHGPFTRHLQSIPRS